MDWAKIPKNLFAFEGVKFFEKSSSPAPQG
jgi:hypothetical protein